MPVAKVSTDAYGCNYQAEAATTAAGGSSGSSGKSSSSC